MRLLHHVACRGSIICVSRQLLNHMRETIPMLHDMGETTNAAVLHDMGEMTSRYGLGIQMHTA